jgi:N-acetylglutamate synthase-like GNAT family acetyltransferase
MHSEIERVSLTDKDVFKEIEEFCSKAGLPFFLPIKDNLLAQFVIRDSKGRMEAAARLEFTFDHPFVEEVAVREDLRGRGLGIKVVGAVLEEARKRGIRTIWVMARAPGFFRNMGFAEAPEKELLEKLIAQCDECRDYRSVCNPKLLKKTLIE